MLIVWFFFFFSLFVGCLLMMMLHYPIPIIWNDILLMFWFCSHVTHIFIYSLLVCCWWWYVLIVSDVFWLCWWRFTVVWYFFIRYNVFVFGILILFLKNKYFLFFLNLFFLFLDLEVSQLIKLSFKAYWLLI